MDDALCVALHSCVHNGSVNLVIERFLVSSDLQVSVVSLTVCTFSSVKFCVFLFLPPEGSKTLMTVHLFCFITELLNQ